jgi:hypothetical protein
MKIDDEGIRAVRNVREKISAEFDNDPRKLVEHYMVEQEQYRDRLLHSTQQTEAPHADSAP